MELMDFIKDTGITILIAGVITGIIGLIIQKKMKNKKRAKNVPDNNTLIGLLVFFWVIQSLFFSFFIY